MAAVHIALCYAVGWAVHRGAWNIQAP